MEPGAFSYLFQKKGTIGADELEALAKVAARRYVSEKIPLCDTIAKLAEERDLNAHQIERICEMANLATHQALWPTAREKEKVAFELADSKKLKVTRAPRPSGSGVDADYAGPPRGIPKTAAPSSAFYAGATDGHAGLGGPTETQRVVISLQKKAAERRRVQGELLVAGMAVETAEKLAYRAVKQEALGGTPMREIVRAASAAGLGKIARQLVPKFERTLIDETHGSVRAALEKRAISRAPEDLISDALGSTTVVNGAHPVLVCLDSVQRKSDAVGNLLQNLIRIDDEVKVFQQRLHELG